MTFQVLISESARKALYDLEEEVSRRIKKAFPTLGENPFRCRSGADIKKLEGSADPTFYRLRIGDYRIVYAIEEKTVKITSIFHRGKGYRWLE